MNDKDQLEALARALCVADGDDPDGWVLVEYRLPETSQPVSRRSLQRWEIRRDDARKIQSALRKAGIALERAA